MGSLPMRHHKKASGTDNKIWAQAFLFLVNYFVSYRYHRTGYGIQNCALPL